MSEVYSIVYKPQHANHALPDRYARVPLDKARLVEGYGIEGDRKGGNPQRQLNIMSYETLVGLEGEGYKVAPGEMGEQIILQGIDVNVLQTGDRLQIGSAVVEILKPRTGCDRFEKIQTLTKEQCAGRMGMMAGVVVSGTISVGDPVKVLEPSIQAS